MYFEISLRHRIGERDIVLDLQSNAPLTALVGISGAGKTTVLNCIAGLMRPDSGRIAIAGEVLLDTRNAIDLPPEQRRAGYVFQDARLFPHMKVAANLAYGEKMARTEDRWITRDKVVDLLGIPHLLQRWPATLSGGEVRRVAIGRALLSAPRFLLLDEPMASLDAARIDDIRRLIEDIRDELQVPTLLVSHDRTEVKRLAGRIFSLD
ncbi:hypothetical protein GCM10009127_07220 [Alteraurantiacibacter aestuarii]|uniref:ATP-binding cassette domain-containing protein n=1 Tax=Alteraurantiacibacter aestuarii TaxID=650004 RepID=A0A844ZUH9_9SPHN|nr:ATP-binding cassette domain-containing protein [Alteraurantiacibacter aestuarii]MXO89199.1 ATP-binding cassette domain-containing protein [Alteraurantiacibacter aestuarii]